MEIPEPGPDVPQTLEGWYVLHDVFSIDWAGLRRLSSDERASVADDAASWLRDSAACEKGDSAAYGIVTQKGDVMFLHYRDSPESLYGVERSLAGREFHDFLIPAYSFLSVIEVSLYEVMAIAMKRLAERGINPNSPEFAEARGAEIERQRKHMDGRLYRDVPAHKYVSFYPMDKKRGEEVNWYALPLEERRAGQTLGAGQEPARSMKGACILAVVPLTPLLCSAQR